MIPKEMTEKLIELHVTPYFYYDRSRPLIATICLLLNGQTFISRGVALCSWRDKFVKRTGRTKACGRAIKALIRKENSMPITTMELSHEENKVYKSRYQPVLNTVEQKILESANKSKQS